MRPREELLAQTFVDVADTLVADFDVVDFLTVLTNRCVELFELSEAGLMLADRPSTSAWRRRRATRMGSSSCSRSNTTKVRASTATEPGAGALRRSGDGTRPMARVRTGGARRRVRFGVRAPDALAGPGDRFAEPASSGAGVLDRDDLVAAQALADVATIGILQHRAAAEQRLLAEQLQYALDSRVTIEQAKGVIAEHRLDMDAAFAALRLYARNKNQRLVDVAHAVVARTLPAGDIAVELASPHPRRRAADG